MPELFGFDARTLTDDQLFTKQVDLIKRKVLATRMGQGDAAAQLDIIVQAIDVERRERMFLDRVKQLPASPIVLETDPEMRENDQAAEEQQKKPDRNPLARPARRIIRSKTPILPTEEL